MDTIARAEFELSTNCACAYCATCNLGTESLICDECQQNTQPMDYCDGDCFEYKLDWLSETVEVWLEEVGNPSRVQINGRSMGWTRASGYAIANADWKDIYKKLQINGDWTLRFTLEGRSLKVTRYSHDEPTGASFEIVPADGEEDSE